MSRCAANDLSHLTTMAEPPMQAGQPSPSRAARAEGPAGLNRALEDLVARRADLRAMALMRVLFGAIVIRHLWPDVTSDVTPVERFHVPWWSWLPVPSPGQYHALVWLGVAAGAAMVLGVAARAATVTATAVVLYLQLVDMTSFAHNRGFLIWILVGLSLLPTGGAFTVVNPLRRWARPRFPSLVPPGEGRPPFGPVWPVFLLQVVTSSVYLTSGGTKLLDADWRSGLVLHDRMIRHEHLIPVDGWLYDVLVSRAFHHLLSPVAIVTELFIGLGLWFDRTRRWAVAVAIVFHAAIEITASVQTFSYSAIAVLLIWTVPTVGRRAGDLTGPAGAPR
jgi:uncharacterized membrane protein YphA (DoxX/SURF4 family)